MKTNFPAIAAYKLRFEQSQINELSARYCEQNSDQTNESYIENVIAPTTKAAGFYTREDFLKVCHWKTPRSQPHCQRNDEAVVREATSVALSANCEQLRIGVLTILHGVSFPTASVLLHFAHADRYPILDFRALESLSIPLPNDYDVDFWNEYVQICRRIADQAEVKMRTLDRALWQFSLENPVSD